MLIVLTTVQLLIEAEALAEKIVKSKLAACVQILPPMTSVYVWEEKLQRETEYLLIIKTVDEQYDELAAFITANHSYEVPEIVAVNTGHVAKPYREWLNAVLSG